MPRTLLAGDDEGDSSQVVGSDFLSPLEHTAIGDNPPHHSRYHDVHSQGDHGITGTPANGQILVYRTSDGKWHTENQPYSSGLAIKSGLVAFGSFSGNPKKYTVAFSAAFANANYSISLLGADARIWTYESKTLNGFIISSNANQALTGDVHWLAVANGETT